MVKDMEHDLQMPQTIWRGTRNLVQLDWEEFSMEPS